MTSLETKPATYRLMVIELDDVVPRRDAKKPNLYVTKTVSELEARFEVIQRGKKTHWYTGHVKKLRSDLAPHRSYMSAEKATDALDKLIRKLKSEGYTVNRDTQVWTVYVIELDSSATTKPGKGYVYVGETSCTPEERFKQHKDGKRNDRGRLYSGVVKEHGVRLRPDLAPRHKFFDQAASKRAEKELFDLLKAKGYNTKGGH
jgi:hypothetical protein